jgi:hypothetical protein
VTRSHSCCQLHCPTLAAPSSHARSRSCALPRSDRLSRCARLPSAHLAILRPRNSGLPPSPSPPARCAHLLRTWGRRRRSWTVKRTRRGTKRSLARSASANPRPLPFAPQAHASSAAGAGAATDPAWPVGSRQAGIGGVVAATICVPGVGTPCAPKRARGAMVGRTERLHARVDVPPTSHDRPWPVGCPRPPRPEFRAQADTRPLPETGDITLETRVPEVLGGCMC